MATESPHLEGMMDKVHHSDQQDRCALRDEKIRSRSVTLLGKRGNISHQTGFKRKNSSSSKDAKNQGGELLVVSGGLTLWKKIRKI